MYFILGTVGIIACSRHSDGGERSTEFKNDAEELLVKKVPLSECLKQVRGINFRLLK